MNGNGRKLVCLLMALLMALGCASALAEQDNLAFAKYDDVVTVSIGRPTIRPYDELGISYDDNLWNDYLMENYNIDANIAWMVDDAADAYNQKVSLTIASGELPDVMIVNNLEQLMWLVREGLVEDLTDTYAQYAAPYVQDFYSSYGDHAFSTATYDGRIMAAPNLISGNNHNMLWIRQDWVEKVGMEMPQTRDELKSVLTAFVEQKVGGENTVGLALNVDVAGNYGSIGNADPIFATFGAFPRQWVRGEDGQYYYGTNTPENKAALQEMHAWYESGIIDRQFASHTNDDIKEMMLSSRCGAIYGPWWYGYDLTNMLVNDPTANWTCVSVPLNDEGKYVALRQNAHREWIVVRKGFEHPEVVWKFISIYWQRGADERINAITAQKDYEAVDMWPIWRMPGDLNYEDCVVREAKEIVGALETGVTEGLSVERVNNYEACLRWLNDGDITAWPTYITRVVSSCEAGTDKLELVDNAYPFPTETMNLAWADMETSEDQMMLKIIIGEEGIDYFDQYVSQWKNMGGDLITEEVNKQLNY